MDNSAIQPKNYEVYLHLNTLNGKGYVGITCRGVRNRLYSHESEARHGSNRPFARAIRKYGLAAFETRVLAQGLTRDEANEAERYYIAKYKTFGPGGYNSTLGGDGTPGHKLTLERRRQISAHFSAMPRTETHRERCSNALKGRVIKPETLDKMRDARKGLRQSEAIAEKSRANLSKAISVWSGMKHSGEAKRRMREAKASLIAIVYPDGRTVAELTTYRDLAERFGSISHSALSAAAKLGRQISKKGPLEGCFIWNLSKPNPPHFASALEESRAERKSKLEGNRNGWTT